MVTELPAGFVDVQGLALGIRVALSYFGGDNFVGRPIDGYAANRAILSLPAAQALARVQHALELRGLGLKIFDAYRPKRAVRHFFRWSLDRQDRATKARYYPDLSKRELFRQGYIARRSSHTRGSTVDLTLVDRRSGVELDMGSAFDFFGPRSWSHYPHITPRQRRNRRLLRSLMLAQGFRPFAMEWWHFTLRDEPYPRRYFDFVVR
jgi:zinc D-Ala-D-Ala dipeptidase